MVWWFVVPAPAILQLVLVAAALVVGVWSAGVIEQRTGLGDPSIVVIDEVAGMWCALLGGRQILWYFLTAFLVFRLLDVLKPGPIQRLQNLPGGWGVMMDDMAAGAVTLLIMTAIRILA